MGIDADVLLVGSVPLASTEEVVNYCGSGLGDIAVGIPDGEVGDRSLWVVFQAYRVFSGHPQLETTQRPQPDFNWRPAGLHDMWQFAIRDGVEELEFDNLGYASNAVNSYGIFRAARDAGTIPIEARFQVSLPLPESGCSWFFPQPEDLARVIPAYEKALLRELATILDQIPHQDLVLQWDVCWEVLDVEGIFPWALPDSDPFERFVQTCQRVSPQIPEEILLGYHYCYADLGHRHMKEPDDLAVAVRMSNAGVAHSGRRVDFTHMPVPIDRSDAAYFAPLADLDKNGPKVFLGLVHHADGLEGSLRRGTAAKGALKKFGIATECGWGRRPAWQVPELIDLHRQVVAELVDDVGEET